MSLFFDVHTHLHDQRILKDARGIMDRAGKAGVIYTATCATMEENFADTLALSRTFGGIIPCFGIHPWFLDTLSPAWEQVLGQYLSASLSAVGETGIDFMEKGVDRDRQIAVFKAHLSLARDLGRPVNIHVRKAWDAFVQILKSMGPLPAGGVVHSYSGSADLIKVLIPFNLYISFSGAATRPNAKKTVKALNAVPLDRILFETDTPDLFPSLAHLPPDPDRLNEPCYVPEVVRICSLRRETAFENLAEQGYHNALCLFDPVMKKRDV